MSTTQRDATWVKARLDCLDSLPCLADWGRGRVTDGPTVISLATDHMLHASRRSPVPRISFLVLIWVISFRQHTTTVAAAASSPSSSASASASAVFKSPPPSSSLNKRAQRALSAAAQSLIPRPVHDFISGVMDGLKDPPPRLGDVWATAGASSANNNDETDDHVIITNAKTSFIAGEIKSIDLPSKNCSTEPSMKKIRVCFRNLTSEPLTLCWMSYSGEPHHFYRLEPVAKCDRSNPSVGHIETTSLGHAFLVAKRTSNHEKKKTNADDEVEELLPSPPSKKLRDCLTLCGKKRRHGDANIDDNEIDDSTQKLSNSDGRCVTHKEVLGGYRPTRAGLETGDDAEHQIHVVTITRRRDQHGLLRGRGRWRYSFEVCEEMLDRTPIDTSNKVYRCIELGGWPVRCEECLWNESVDNSTIDPKQLQEEEKLKALIAEHLAAAVRYLPPGARNTLRENTPIYINRSQKFGPKVAPVEGRDMCFHPVKSWLIENGMSPKKAGCVEIYRVGNYSRDCHLWGAGGVLLHELSHAYHHKCLEGGYDNVEVKECYDNAMKEGLYDKVKVHNLKGTDMCKAYACTDQMEYFAELSSAFLGGLDNEEEYNKWFPFNRKQIKEHDPKAYDMLKRMWGVEDN